MTEPGNDELLAKVADPAKVQRPLYSEEAEIAAEELAALNTEPAEDEPGEQHAGRDPE